MTLALRRKWAAFESAERLCFGLNDYEQACCVAFNAVMMLDSLYKVNRPKFLWNMRQTMLMRRHVVILNAATLEEIARRYRRKFN